MSICPSRAKIIVVLAAVGAALPLPAGAQVDQVQAAKPHPFTLTLEGEIDPELAPVVGRMTALFYECYPKLVERFENPKQPASREVRVAFRRGLKAPAECSGAKITVSVEWLEKHPQDIGLLTHELVHVVQAYPSPEPSWLTEGLADYARHLYGPKEQPGWALPERLTDKQSYRDSYGVSARFFHWLEMRHPGTVDKLHRRMQARAFDAADFQTFTGHSLTDLWDECVRDLRGR
jgi:hypothetical protein